MDLDWISNSIKNDLFRTLGQLDKFFHPAIRHLRWAMVRSIDQESRKLTLPKEVNADRISVAIRRYYDQIKEIDDINRSLRSEVSIFRKDFEFNPHLGIIDEFRNRVAMDIARLELLNLAKEFSIAHANDVDLFNQAISCIESRVCRYINSIGYPVSTGGIQGLIQNYSKKWKFFDWFKRDKNSCEVESRAVFRAVVLERAMSQGINIDEAEIQEHQHWE